MTGIRSIGIAVVGVLVGMASPATSAEPVDPLVAYGKYVATAGDCEACHTVPGGGSYAGGLAIKSPVGTIYSSNITPSTTHGIGAYTRDQFDRAMRKGIRSDGANLYPAMPYTAYANYSDHDIDALYAFLMKKVAPVEKSPPETSLPFPASVRLAMAAWNLLFLDDDGFKSDPAQSQQWNRGRYLVEGPAHCNTCHTPRGYLMEEQTSRAFTGGQVGPWYAPNITRDEVDGIGRWTRADLTGYLRTGVAREHGARAAGSMAEAIEKSFRYLTDSDIDAIVVFIESVPAAKDAAASGPRFARGQARSMIASTRGNPVGNPGGGNRAAVLFQGRCATCHAVSGEGGEDGHFPSLFHSSTTGANNSNLVATILNGVDRTTDAGQAFMPGFGGKSTDMNQMTNADVALVANFLLTQYGDRKPTVTEKDVATIRDGGPTSSLIAVAQVGFAVAVVVGSAIAWWVFRRYRSKRRRVS